ncbi:MAG: hypothetical protein ABII12_08835 [Planctomycetota bacterium]
MKPIGRSAYLFAALACALVATGCATTSSQVEVQPAAAAEPKAALLSAEKSRAANPQAQTVWSSESGKKEAGPAYRCASPTVTAEPSWPNKTLRFAFDIQNVGDAVLTLKAKAG